MSHRIEVVDGIRGICVLAVMIFHYTLFPAGWLGVPIFFILSGYLISKKLLTLPHFNFVSIVREHYAPRISRILPLYCLVLLLVGCLYLVTLWPQELPKALLYLGTFTFNLYPLLTRDESPHVISHLWTLSTELQFYLLWPLVLLACTRRSTFALGLGFILLAPITRATLALALSAGLSPEMVSRSIYYFPLSHLDSFGVGILLAWAGEGSTINRAARSKYLVVLLSVITIISGALTCLFAVRAGAATMYDALSVGYPEGLLSEGKHIFLLSLITALSGLIIHQGLNGSHILQWLFSSRSIRRCGVLCFGLYMIHLPLLEGVRFFFGIQPRTGEGLLLLPVYLFVSYLLAELSFRGFEATFYRPSQKHSSHH